MEQEHSNAHTLTGDRRAVNAVRQGVVQVGLYFVGVAQVRADRALGANCVYVVGLCLVLTGGAHVADAVGRG